MKFTQIMLLITLVVCLSVVLIQTFYNNLLPSFFNSFFFLWLMIFYYMCIWNFHFKGGFTLLLAFILFFISGVLTSIYLIEYAEFLMRCSLVIWIIGLIQSMIEYKGLPRTR